MTKSKHTLDRDHFMTAEEAKDFGLIDQVLISRDDIERLPTAEKTRAVELERGRLAENE